MPSPPVALAIVERGERWLVNRRLSGDTLDGLWEFPGGKIQEGETPSEAAVRECREEIAITVEPLGELPSVSYRYESGEVELHPILCRILTGEPRTSNPAIGEIRWVGASELESLPMPPANRAIVAELLRSHC